MKILLKLQKKKKKIIKNKRTEFAKRIQYVVIKDNDKMRRYSKLAFNNNQNTAYYYCTDKECIIYQ